MLEWYTVALDNDHGERGLNLMPLAILFLTLIHFCALCMMRYFDFSFGSHLRSKIENVTNSKIMKR